MNYFIKDNIPMGSFQCLCLHGFGENRCIYDAFVTNMTRIMPTFSADLMGHGEYRLDEYNIENIISDIDRIIENTEAENIILAGTSFGGIVNYIFSSQNQTKYPESRDRVKGLIVNDVPCCVPKQSFTNVAVNLIQLAKKNYENIDQLNLDYIKNGFRRDREPITDEHWEHFLSTSLVDGKVNYDIKFIDLLLSKVHGIVSIAENVSFQTLPDGTEALDLRYYWDAITKPILLFRGERTTFFPRYIRDLMSQNELLSVIEIPDGGHFIDISRTEIMNYIQSWLHKSIY